MGYTYSNDSYYGHFLTIKNPIKLILNYLHTAIKYDGIKLDYIIEDANDQEHQYSYWITPVIRKHGKFNIWGGVRVLRGHYHIYWGDIQPKIFKGNPFSHPDAPETLSYAARDIADQVYNIIYGIPTILKLNGLKAVYSRDKTDRQVYKDALKSAKFRNNFDGYWSDNHMSDNVRTDWVYFKTQRDAELFAMHIDDVLATTKLTDISISVEQKEGTIHERWSVYITFKDPDLKERE